MRFYEIKFEAENGKLPESLTQGGIDYSIFTSHPKGIYNPGCPEIEFDVLLAWEHFIREPFVISVKNIPAQMLQYAKEYNQLKCTVTAGYAPNQPGGSMLPLETAFAKNTSVIAVGYVQNCFANWIGTNLIMQFLINPCPIGSANLPQSGTQDPTSPQNYLFNWPPEGSLFDALETTMKTFYKESIVKIVGTISDKVEYNNSKTAVNFTYSNFAEFAEGVRNATLAVLNPENRTTSGNGNFQGYRGVYMHWDYATKNILLWDGTATTGFNKQGYSLDYFEFIGQPTWTSAAGVVQSVHPMNPALKMTTRVKYPQIPQVQTGQFAHAGGYSGVVLNAANQILTIQMVRHVGRYRDTSADAWATFINAGSAVRFDPGTPAELNPPPPATPAGWSPEDDEVYQ